MYIQIEQGLQNIAAFVYFDIQKEELDAAVTNRIYKFIELIFLSEKEKQRIENQQFQEVQAILDDFRILEVKNTFITVLTAHSQGMYGALPANYQHLINDRTLITKTCGLNTFVDVEVVNRLTKSEPIYNVLDNTMSKTSVQSPISEITGNSIYVYNLYKGVKQFDIKEIRIDYLKKPAVIDYNGGAGGGSQVLEFPNATCFKLIKMTINYLMEVSQQNQQKIINLQNATS